MLNSNGDSGHPHLNVRNKIVYKMRYTFLFICIFDHVVLKPSQFLFSCIFISSVGVEFYQRLFQHLCKYDFSP